VLAILAVLAGNVAAARDGCCQWGPLAADCCCHCEAAERIACPHCPSKRSCCAKKRADAARPAQFWTRACRCEKHLPAPAVVESHGRLKVVGQVYAATLMAQNAQSVSPLSFAAAELRETLHPPRRSLAVLHCSWQV